MSRKLDQIALLTTPASSTVRSRVSERALQNLLLVLFTFSGLAGLIYESVWSSYLKLFLGHAAYAQTLVLMVFMGGMALGSWLSARFSSRWANPLRAYAAIEAAIGGLGLIFHPVFDRTTFLAYTSLLPALELPPAISLVKWVLASLLILPQSVLLGMTFPVMSVGLIRRSPADAGWLVAMLYFTNSLGAAVGVLLSGYLLIGWVGLPGTVQAAALVNLIVAVVMWTIAMPDRPRTATAQSQSDPTSVSVWRLLLAVSLLTGTASFMYEIGWIRMLSLVLGSSTHAFELMLSAFILGLAAGGLWIRRRLDRLPNMLGTLATVQIAMGLCALVSLGLYGQSFELVRVVEQGLSKTEAGYWGFNVVSFALALGLMFPTTFCAGMTLPLLTAALLKHGCGERSVGAVYAANTFGAIVGALGATHLGLPLLGLKGLMTVAAALDMMLGLAVLWAWSGTGTHTRRLAASAICLVAVGLTVIAVCWNPVLLASGVYRFGTLLDPSSFQVLFHTDGKTATVDLLQGPDGDLSLRTNGKSDATVGMQPGVPARPDEYMGVLLAAIPLALHPDAKTVANIGIGSGLTSRVILASPVVRQLDTIEIEAGMVTAARRFGDRVRPVFVDPRSRIHIDDARSYLSSHATRYDLIVSEPSNPWVSGVSSLFTDEFFRLVRGRLAEHGVLAQWIQLYEVDGPLVMSVLKAVSKHFRHVALYAAINPDLLIIASNDRDVVTLHATLFQYPELARELRRINVLSLSDLEVRSLGSERLWRPLIERSEIPVNSDYYPYLDLNATRTRFLHQNATEFDGLNAAPVPLFELLDGGRPIASEALARPHVGLLSSAEHRLRAVAMRDYLLNRTTQLPPEIPLVLQKDLELVKLGLLSCKPGANPQIWFPALFEVAEGLTGHLAPREQQGIWDRMGSGSCGKGLPPLSKRWLALFRAIGTRDTHGMASVAEGLLEAKTPTELKDYLFTVALIGHLAQGHRKEALEFWDRYAAGVLEGRSPTLLWALLHTSAMQER